MLSSGFHSKGGQMVAMNDVPYLPTYFRNDDDALVK